MRERRAEAVALMKDRHYMQRLTWEQQQIVRDAFVHHWEPGFNLTPAQVATIVQERLDERTQALATSLIVKISEVSDALAALPGRGFEAETAVSIASKKRGMGVSKLTEVKKDLQDALYCAEAFDQTGACESVFEGLRKVIAAQERLLESRHQATVQTLTRDLLHS